MAIRRFRTAITTAWSNTVLVALVLTIGLVLTGVNPALAQVEGLEIQEDTVYTVSDTEVFVESVFTITNTTVDSRDGDTIYYQFYEDFVVPVPIGATELTIESNGTTLASEFRPMPEPDPDFQFVLATLPTRLRAGQTRLVTMSYGLPAGELRGDNLFVSNPAFHGFPMWSNSDAGTGSIELRVPEASSVAAFGEELELVETVDGLSTWVPSSFENPQAWYTYVTVQNPAARDETTLTASGQTIIVKSWPGDTEWAEFAEETITAGLPALEAVIGIPVPEQSTLEINESVDPYLYGFAGWYTLDDTSIEVGNELDDAVLLHEISHAWFNGRLFGDRWIGEGLAEEFTWRAQDTLGWPTKALPAEPSLDDEYAQRLTSWDDRQATIENADEFEQADLWAYEASWWAVREMVEVAGIDTMQEVIAAGAADEISYAQGDSPEIYSANRDWQDFYDLLVERSDDPATIDAELEPLFRDLIVTENALDQLDRRAAARTEYGAFANDPLDWDVPLAVREAMTDWEFTTAEALIADAQSVKDRYVTVRDAAEAEGLMLSTAAEELYESAGHDVRAAIEILDRQEAAIATVLAVRAAADADRSITTRWGGGADLERFVDAAESAFAEDRFDDIDVAAVELQRARSDAAQSGRTRLILLSGLVVAAAVVMFVVARSRRTPVLLALNAGEPQPTVVKSIAPSLDIGPPDSSSITPAQTDTPSESLVGKIDLIPEVGPPKAERVTPPVATPPPIPPGARPAPPET